MNIIEKVTEEDIGRIAVSKETVWGCFVVKVLSASNEYGECIVEHLEESCGTGIANNFSIIGGGWPMMWKDGYSNPRRKNKPKKHPPKRKKTDVTLNYVDGKSYTLKNVKSITCNIDKWDKSIHFRIQTEVNKIKSSVSVSIPVEDIHFIDIKSPSGKMSVIFYHEYVDIIDVDLTFTQKVDELNFIKRFK
ncbi:hypothetical protein [Klebsiella phage 05F01]|nr:hypothetical protein [Klebsiella phage 05F01]